MSKKQKNPTQLAAELEPICTFLDQAGQPGFAAVVGQTIASLRAQAAVKSPPGGVVTTGEAAKALGIRSPNTIKRWVQDGQLEGFRLGGRVMVSQRSIQRLSEKAIVSRQQQWEDRVREALEPFEVTERESIEADAAWEGRRPWDMDGRSSTAARASANSD